MIEQLKIRWFYILSFSFLILFSISILFEFYWFWVLPVLLFLLLLYLFRLDKVLMLVTLLTPLSMNFDFKDYGVAVLLPTEPLLFGILCVFTFKVLIEKYDNKIIKHPLSIAIFFNLFWILVTSFTSTLPIVSFKFLLARLWFVVPLYFFAILVFKEEKNIRHFFWLYMLTLVVVIGIILTDFISRGLDQKVANWIVAPFFNDHTSYGAVLAMYIPIAIALVSYYKKKTTLRMISLIVSIILIIALVLSYTRAAWLSMGVGFIIFIFIYFKVKLRYIILGILALTTLIILHQNEFFYKLEKNKHESSTDFAQHLQSISNISSDASNLERLNRWSAAWRMFLERPVFGFGPGTYQMNYAPYQLSREKTIISTNAGDRGNAHSEYFGPLTESGLIGMLSFIAIVVVTFITGIRVYKNAKEPFHRKIALAILIGYITYVVHGGMNNFLDTDKASVPFWGFSAILVAMDLFLVKSSKLAAESNPDNA